MIKLIIFDLDGVLVNTKDIHFHALNKALENFSAKYKISKIDHLNKFDGMPTKEKLKLLTKNKNLPKNKYKLIIKDKNKFTENLIKQKIKKSVKLISLFKNLNQEYKIAVASNAIKRTVNQCLTNLQLKKYVHYIVSNEDIDYPKPNPQIYLKCMVHFGVYPKETIILEDSSIGRKSAINSGAHLIPIESTNEVNKKNIDYFIQKSDYNKLSKMEVWTSDNLNILIPMAGEGKRFSDAGYSFPKPLIEVNKKPMIQLVIENLGINANYIFIVQKKHLEKYNLKYFLNLIMPNCKIVEVDSKTEGAACTTLLAKKFINNNNQLMIANSDQFIKWNPIDAMYFITNKKIDGAILTFKSSHPKWSFAKVDKNGFVTEVAEKKPISNDATVGVYFWNKGSDYVKYANKMIEKNIRTNNEFYVCPVYNEAILDKKKIINYEVDEMWGLGTPEDLNYYLSKNK